MSKETKIDFLAKRTKNSLTKHKLKFYQLIESKTPQQVVATFTIEQLKTLSNFLHLVFSQKVGIDEELEVEVVSDYSLFIKQLSNKFKSERGYRAFLSLSKVQQINFFKKQVPFLVKLLKLILT